MMSKPESFSESLGSLFRCFIDVNIVKHMFVNDGAAFRTVVFVVDCCQMLRARELTARYTDWCVVFVANSMAVFNLAHAHIFVIIDRLIAHGACGNDDISVVCVVRHIS